MAIPRSQKSPNTQEIKIISNKTKSEKQPPHKSLNMIVRNNVILLYGCTVPISQQNLDQIVERHSSTSSSSSQQNNNNENEQWKRFHQLVQNQKPLPSSLSRDNDNHWTLDERIMNQFLRAMDIDDRQVSLFNDKSGRFYIYLKRIYVHEWNMIAFDFDHEKREMLHCDFCGDVSKQFDQRCAVPNSQEVDMIKSAMSKLHGGQMYNIAYMAVHYTS